MPKPNSSPRSKVSSVPGLVLDWIPVWVRLHIEVKDEAFIRVADPQVWDSPVMVDSSPPADASLEKTMPWTSYLAPVFARSFMFGATVFLALRTMQSELAWLASELSWIWFSLIAGAAILIYFSASIYSSLQRQFQLLYGEPAERRRILVLRYEMRSSSAWRVRRRSIPMAVASVVLVIIGASGYVVELLADPEVWTATAKGSSLRDLEGMALVHQRVEDGDDDVRWTITFLALPVPTAGWNCFEFEDPRRVVSMQWVVSFPADTEGLSVLTENSAWEVTANGVQERQILGPDNKVVLGTRADHTEFEATASLRRLPPPLKLRLPPRSEGLRQVIAQTEVKIILSGALKCAIPTGEVWTLGQDAARPLVFNTVP